MSYQSLEMQVVQWGEARGIIQNSTTLAQGIKTLEEVTELLAAINTGDKNALIDAYGDILVTLIMGCAIADVSLVSCLEHAYAQIKDRKGYLDNTGVFHKKS